MKLKGLIWFIVILLIIFVIMYVIYLIKKDKGDNTPVVNEIKDIKEIDYSYSVGYAMNAYYKYDLLCEDKCTIKIKPNGYPEEDTKEYEVDDESINKIIDILKKYEVYKWDGYSKSDKNVLDGDSFTFIVRFKDGSSIHASGYMMWPDNYRNVKNELEEIFNSFIKEGDFNKEIY